MLLAWLCSITWTIAWQIGSNSLYLILYMQTQKIPIDGKSYLEHEQRNLIISMIATCSQLIGLWCIKYAFLAFLWNLGPKDGIKTHKIMWWFAVSYGLVALVISMAVLPWPCLITNQDWRTFASKSAIYCHDPRQILLRLLNKNRQNDALHGQKHGK